MKGLARRAFALLVLGVLGGCQDPNDEFGSWKVVVGKDKTTSAERFRLVATAYVGGARLALTCTKTESPIFMLITDDRLGRSETPQSVYVRAGDKQAILQPWITGESVAFPEKPLIGFELVNYIGPETKLVIRVQGERDRYDYTFDVIGLPGAFAKMKKVCDGQVF